MSVRLFFRAIFKFLMGLVLVGLLLFLPAGTFAFRNAWILIGILFVPMFLAGLVMIAVNPGLLEKRLNAKEEEKEQKTVIALSGIVFLAAFIVAGLNHRFGWLEMPGWLVVSGGSSFPSCLRDVC